MKSRNNSNILLLSPFFYPELISTGKYNTHLAAELAKQGFNVDVWCSHPLYPQWKITKSDRKLKDINIIRGGRNVIYPSSNILRRGVLELWYFFFILSNLVFRKETYRYDLTIAIVPPSLYTLLLPFFKSKCPVCVGIVHDLQSEYAILQDGKIGKILNKAIQWVERRSFQSFSHLVYLSKSMQHRANDLYGIEKELTSISYPFVTLDSFIDRGNLKHIIPDDEKSIVYSGAMGEKQNIDGLFELFELILKSNSEVVIHVFSQGPIFDEQMKKHTSARLKFHPLVPENDVGELLLRSTIQIVPQIEGSSNGSLPSKLPNILASGCKVFCITDPGSELYDLLAQYPNGMVSSHWNAEANSTSILSLLEKHTVRTTNTEMLKSMTLSSLTKKLTKMIST